MSLRLAKVQAGTALQKAHYAKKAPEEGSDYVSRIAQFATEVMTPAPVQSDKRTPEELADAERRCKDFSRRCMRKERLWQMDLNEKIKLRNAAIAALPEQYLAAACQFNRETFPIERLIFTDTPPKKGGEKVKVKKTRKIGTKKD